MITQTKQVVDKMKDEAAGVLIEEFVGFGICYTVIVSITRERTETKNVVATVSHSE